LRATGEWLRMGFKGPERSVTTRLNAAVFPFTPSPTPQHPRAPESEDKTEFKPKSKVGKMAIEAAAKLVALSRPKCVKPFALSLACVCICPPLFA
jgi:hypothetical protein